MGDKPATRADLERFTAGVSATLTASSAQITMLSNCLNNNNNFQPRHIATLPEPEPKSELPVTDEKEQQHQENTPLQQIESETDTKGNLSQDVVAVEPSPNQNNEISNKRKYFHVNNETSNKRKGFHII
ncbi:hypothetical protein L195_g009634 [Trifolium pratense]|uniref:Uncharacterized protein n=1 Tax=Trifolium pratense TaxID=57577 RepID=A0A2K3L671_TRIPR|nr:hypothetical protein L195_g029946 [Trifolium pratense]PNX74789.1 hypothetical protein L195_g030716 [Trifolium pratense]PNY12989.1 hypothetical protein L195_g009634 [Trifolium pratense]